MSCKDGCRCKYCGEDYQRENQIALIEELFATKKGLREEKEGADIVVDLRVAVAERAFVPHCSRCDGDGQTEAGTCEWCAGEGISARDEAQRIATALYGAWLRGWL